VLVGCPGLEGQLVFFLEEGATVFGKFVRDALVGWWAGSLCVAGEADGCEFRCVSEKDGDGVALAELATLCTRLVLSPQSSCTQPKLHART
jgi:hypothetical protein